MGARTNILNRLKQASNNRGKIDLKNPDWKKSVYIEQGDELAENFAGALEQVAGTVIRTKNIETATTKLKQLLSDLKIEKVFCSDLKLKKAFSDKINYSSRKNDFEKLDTSITCCEFLVAHLGSVMVSSAGTNGRRVNVFPETHIVFAHEKQIVKYLHDGINKLLKKYKGKLPSMVTNIAGPSRTADIEKTLVIGVHGPRKLFVFLCEEPF